MLADASKLGHSIMSSRSVSYFFLSYIANVTLVVVEVTLM